MEYQIAKTYNMKISPKISPKTREKDSKFLEIFRLIKSIMPDIHIHIFNNYILIQSVYLLQWEAILYNQEIRNKKKGRIIKNSLKIILGK